MRFHRTLLPLSLVAALSACTAAQEESPDKESVQEPAPAEVSDPMASFGRLVSGEWWVTQNAGASGFNTWHWGPGKHSVRVAHAVDVYYWHPGRKQVCMLSLSSYARGVAEGRIQFEGDTAETVFDLYQTTGHRTLVTRWAFDGPDQYREELFEPTGAADLAPMSAWVHVRSRTPTVPRAPTAEEAEEATEPSERMQVFEPLLRHTWEAEGEWASGEALHLQTSFELIAGVDGIYASTMALTQDSEPMHVLDAYLYHHTGTGLLRSLALSNGGGVYEGDLTVLAGGALQLDLHGYEGDQVVPHVVRFDFEPDGTLRQRVWSLEGTDRKLLLDVHHAKVEPKKG